MSKKSTKVRRLGRTITENPKPKYRLELFVESEKYKKYADIINALFEKGSYVTKDEVDSAIKNYLERSI